MLTSPALQGLHRGGVLAALVTAAGAFLVACRSVADELQRSREAAGPDLVPDVAELELRVEDVGTAEVEAAGAEPAGSRRGRETFAFRGRRVDRTELESALLARRLGARLVTGDREGLRAARALDVPTLGVAHLLVELEREGAVPDAAAVARIMLINRYYSRDLEWLSRGVWPPAARRGGP